MSVGKRLILEKARNVALTARMDVMLAEQAMKLAEDNVRIADYQVENADLRARLTTAEQENLRVFAERADLQARLTALLAERDALVKEGDARLQVLEGELKHTKRLYQDGLDCVPFCHLSSAVETYVSAARSQRLADGGRK